MPPVGVAPRTLCPHSAGSDIFQTSTGLPDPPHPSPPHPSILTMAHHVSFLGCPAPGSEGSTFPSQFAHCQISSDGLETRRQRHPPGCAPRRLHSFSPSGSLASSTVRRPRSAFPISKTPPSTRVNRRCTEMLLLKKLFFSHPRIPAPKLRIPGHKLRLSGCPFSISFFFDPLPQPLRCRRSERPGPQRPESEDTNPCTDSRAPMCDRLPVHRR